MSYREDYGLTPLSRDEFLQTITQITAALISSGQFDLFSESSDPKVLTDLASQIVVEIESLLKNEQFDD